MKRAEYEQTHPQMPDAIWVCWECDELYLDKPDNPQYGCLGQEIGTLCLKCDESLVCILPNCTEECGDGECEHYKKSFPV